MADRQLDWRLFWLTYGLIAAAFVVRTLYNAGSTPLIADTDDAMRLVVVRDLLGGQAWYDPVQHRMNAPFGAELHWSRLADLPMAALVLVLAPFFGGPLAETIAASVIPLVWLGVLLYLSARIALRLAGPEGVLPAVVLPALSVGILTEFAPGRIDHHSLQILLLMTMLWATLESLRRPGFAALAGLAAATSLALGIEGIPAVAATILAFGLIWVTTPSRADALRWFGLSLGVATVVHLAIALPPDRWMAPACDAISIVYAGAAAGVGIVCIGLSLLPPTLAGWQRLAAGVAAGLLLAVGLALIFPHCLRGPYSALDPVLLATWIDAITEALPLATSMLQDPVYPLAIAVPVGLALIVVGWKLATSDPRERLAWVVYGAFLLLAAVAMLIQIRASRMATPLAVPAGAWLIVAARRRYLERQNVRRTALLLLSWVGSAGVAVAVIVMGLKAALPAPGTVAGVAETPLVERRQCVMPASFSSLAAIPPERIMAPVDLGSHLLAFTPHHVVGAPYHRNADGVRDTFAFFNGPIAAGREILEQRGISLVVTCDGLPEMRGRRDASPDSFVRLVEAGTLPDWLVETSPAGETLRVFAVLPR